MQAVDDLIDNKWAKRDKAVFVTMGAVNTLIVYWVSYAKSYTTGNYNTDNSTAVSTPCTEGGRRCDFEWNC